MGMTWRLPAGGSARTGESLSGNVNRAPAVERRGRRRVFHGAALLAVTGVDDRGKHAGRPARIAAHLALVALVACSSGAPAGDQAAAAAGAAGNAAAEQNGGAPGAGAAGSSTAAGGDVERGLLLNTPRATAGYTLFTPLLSDTTYLIDNDGLVVHTWKSDYAPSGSVYLLDNGNLLRGAREPGVAVFKGGGQGGRIQELTWDGELVWDFAFASEDHLLHHDIEPLPNGNLLAIAWEAKSAEEARAAGLRPDLTPEAGVWPDMVIEIEPQRPSGGRIVWEWHAWDHLVQSHDEGLPGYGEPARHPRRIDINGAKPPEIDPEELEQLKALGYVPADAQPEDLGSDLLHTNAVAYNAELDQIALSTPRLHEIWIIDHSTTAAEAASSSGGRWGHGGDLLYRWGNPAAYGRGDDNDQRLFGQHDVRWIPAGFPGAGNLLVYNNAVPEGEGSYSTVVELVPPIDPQGRYVLPGDAPFGPASPFWEYVPTDKLGFSSPFISGATRLPNGNTLICAGAPGRFFEVTPAGEIVWDYRDPHSGDVRMADGSTPHPVGEFTYAVFRATKVLPHHPALAGRTLAPIDPQPPVAGR